MGWKWEVSAWVRVDHRWGGGHTYTWEHVYGGPNPLRAAWEARKAKRAGAGCVKVEWR